MEACGYVGCCCKWFLAPVELLAQRNNGSDGWDYSGWHCRVTEPEAVSGNIYELRKTDDLREDNYKSLCLKGNVE